MLQLGIPPVEIALAVMALIKGFLYMPASRLQVPILQVSSTSLFTCSTFEYIIILFFIAFIDMHSTVKSIPQAGPATALLYHLQSF